MKYSRCQHENSSEMKFCGECGTPLKAVNPTGPPAPSYAELTSALTEAHAQVSEALEQHTATSEILQVISRSPTDVQLVFETIVASIARLCGAADVGLALVDGEVHRVTASVGPFFQNWRPDERSVPTTRGAVAGRAILDRTTVHVHDLAVVPEEEYPVGRALQRRFGHHTMLAVPLVRDGVPLGVIAAVRTEVRPFTERQIDLVQTFADQAVIAIENVRLFNETKEALDQQTATSEILGVISRSPTDIQPVLDAVAESAARLCNSFDAAIFRRDGDRLLLVAHHGPIPLGTIGGFTIPLVRGTASGRAVLDGRTVQVADLQAEADEFPEGSELARREGHRTILSVPLMREGAALGAISVRRPEARLFTDRQVVLLQTFADQAVIAIENVRLFTELQEKNRALTEAHAQVTETLEQQTATSEILGVISSSPTDAQPVFEAIVRSASRLCSGEWAIVTRYDGELVHLVAQYNAPTGLASATERLFPRPPRRDLASARAILEGAVVHIPDANEDTDLAPGAAGIARSFLSVPMMREGVPIGAIGVSRGTPGPFAPEQIALLKTFADQAIIAIENVRLFKELEARNRDLTATSEILQIIASSPTDTQPVFDAIARSVVQLCEGLNTYVFLFDGEKYRPVAFVNASPETLAYLQRNFPGSPTRGSTWGRAILDRTVVHIPDVTTDPEYEFADVARADNFRSALAAPLLREGVPIGAITVARRSPFSEKQTELVKTFADQAVIAIENVRLFKELEARTQELTRSVDELTALGDVSRALSSTLDLETVLQTIATRANQLAGTAGCTIWEYDDSRAEFRLRVSHYAEAADAAILPAPGGVTTIPRGQGLTTQVIERRQPVQIPDIAGASGYESPIRQPLIQAGHRALLGVPLLREEEVIGVLAVTRKTPGEFAPEIVRLLTTFAIQSALAIQNARLFLEIEDKGRQLEAASRHKSEFLANMSHELRTPLNAIIGFSEVLSEGMFGEINEKQTEYLKDILESGQHLLSLINDILDLSKIEAGRMELEATDFDLPSAIENALILVRERAGRRGITLGREIDERLSTIHADERKVKQVLLNLLSNALKFTPEDGWIDVRAALYDDQAEISVTDTGVGIAPEDQEAVFEEFRQVGTAAKKVEGTGLGLALSRKFIELHGGRIWVKSRVGVGSTFTFTLPVRPGE